jgi:catechol 2,3-dioxygenase-like lactoylglutathione lyase family enzyme
MNHNYITGIQQIGIGVRDAHEAMLYYKELFGMDVLIFNDVAEAKLMTQYTGNIIYQRNAILSLNMTGGGGFEIWQYLNRKPQAPSEEIKYGDLGIYAAKIKCLDIETAFQFYKKKNPSSEILQDSEDKAYFWVRDKYGNQFQVVEAVDYFSKGNAPTGAISGAVIGVSDMDAAIKFYGCLLGEYSIVYDKKELLKNITDNDSANYRKVLLRKKASTQGAFGKLLGGIDLELVQALDRTPCKIYKDRFWGDLGFIHLCLDVVNMDELKKHAQENNYTFTVDSNETFDMENAGGRFCYVEDPDGTLMELVETHKVPVIKTLGVYLNLKKRGLSKPLPNWMIKMLSISKVK